MSKKSNIEENTPTYEVIFRFVENDKDQNEVEALRRESEEINELRKMVLEVTEPARQYITASSIPAVHTPNFSLRFSN